ncbi:S-layer homology domain-containing protein [Agathobaculum sp.]|uniref:S-layer homology domain-containing protein n=1 Tax=Agathobaculum sp. TaxID=2048138 RepID=UPI003AB2627A
MKRRNNRFLAGTLAGLMMLTMLPVTALAAADGVEGNAAVETEGGSNEQGNNEDNIFNVVNDFDTQKAGGNASESNLTGGENGAETGAPAGGNDAQPGEGGAESGAPVGEGEGGAETGGSAVSGETGGEQGGADSSKNDSAPAPAPAETFTAKIGSTEYETLDAAINAAQDGDTIEIGENCTLTVGTIEKAVVINGNDKTISIPEQNTENHALNINASLTFNKATVEFPDAETSTHSWAFTMNREGKLTLDNGSTCIIKHQIIDACNDATINVLNGSVLKVLDAGWTAIHGADEKENVQYSFLNIKGGSTVEIDKAKSVNKEEDGEANGITSCKIDVENSTLTITNCENQGLVRCWLTLDNSNAEISGNDMGITGYADTDVLTMKNGATLLIKDNAHSGIFMYGGNVDVQGGTELTITGTGNSVSDEVVEGYYVGALAIRTAEPANANVKFADKATVNLIDNAVSAIRNCGTIEIGADTVIKNNGSKTKYGGGIRNYGEITVSAGAQLYNNHALNAGDDIYNGTYKYKTYTCDGRITFAPVGENWVLDDCKDPIVGWYQDGAGKRWNGDATDESYYAKEYIVVPDTVVVPDTAVSDALALKAAHGKFCNVTYEVTGDIPSDAGNPPASAKVKMGGSYTVAPAQTTSQSRYTFSGWRADGTGDIVTSLENLQQDVKLVGVWSYRSGGGSGGGGGRKPTVDIPDDVPTGLNGDDHFAYIVGYPDGNVKPSGNITRAEVATIFFRLLTEDVRTANSTQSNSLSDVSRGQWFNHAISTLSSMGIVKGNPDGTFDPDAPITRAEFAAIAARFDDKNTNNTSNFSDIASHWAKDEIGVAANKGWINGYPDSTFRPDQYITRAEAMTLVNRVLNRLPEKSEDLLDDMIKWPDNADASVWYYLAVQEATNSHDYSDKSDADKYEKWTKIRDARDWTLLEK